MQLQLQHYDPLYYLLNQCKLSQNDEQEADMNLL